MRRGAEVWVVWLNGGALSRAASSGERRCTASLAGQECAPPTSEGGAVAILHPHPSTPHERNVATHHPPRASVPGRFLRLSQHHRRHHHQHCGGARLLCHPHRVVLDRQDAAH